MCDIKSSPLSDKAIYYLDTCLFRVLSYDNIHFSGVTIMQDVPHHQISWILHVPAVWGTRGGYAMKMLMSVWFHHPVAMVQLVRIPMAHTSAFVHMVMKAEIVLSTQMTVLHVSFYAYLSK